MVDSTPNKIELSESEKKLRDYNEASKLGRTIVATSKERGDRKLTPFTDEKKLSPDSLGKIGPKSAESISDAEIQSASVASFSIALETAVQITEARLNPNAPIREDINSLEQMMRCLKGGVEVAKKFGDQEAQNKVIIQETRKILAKKNTVPVDELKMEDKQILEQFNRWYGAAIKRINTSLELARSYRR